MVSQRRVVLHVGAMKSGTSFVQSMLFHHKAALLDAGVLVPGENWNRQVRAVKRMLEKGPLQAQRWQDLVAEMRDHAGTGVVSMEFLGPVLPDVAQRAVASLGADRVEVVITARDLNRTLVSMWQETIQNGRSWTFEEYLDQAQRTRPGTGRGIADRETAGGTFWRQQHLARMVDDWAGVVGIDAVRLVTVPPPGAAPDVLAVRFAEAAAIPLPTEAPPAGANESLGLPSLLALREVNERLDAAGIVFPEGQIWRKRRLAKEILAARKREEPSLGLPVARWVALQTEQTRDALRASGVRLVGEWSDLDPVEVPGVTPDDVDAAAVASAAIAGLAGVLERAIRD